MIEKENAMRILVVDDHSVVREGLTAIIDRQREMMRKARRQS